MNENLLGNDSFKKSDNAETTTQTFLRPPHRTITELTPKFNQGQDYNGMQSDNDTQPINSTATRKLTLVCCVCCVFMLIEFFGGLLSDSIAIMTDAAHLLSDLAGFLISIYALHVSSKKADAYFTFGYHRAEIVGAVSSVFIIWILTAVLLVESIARIFDSHHHVNGKIMLITSSIGLVFNGVMAFVLHSGGSLSEGGHHYHHHGHGHEGNEHENEQGPSLLRKDEHYLHDHHNSNDNHSHSNCEHNHTHHHSQERLITNCNNDDNDNNIHASTVKNQVIIEEPNEENGSANSLLKLSPKKYIEMKQIQSIKEDLTLNSNNRQLKNMQKEINKSFESKTKESLILNRKNKSDFDDDIDKDNELLKKRKSENITINIRKRYYNMTFNSPHVSKHLTRDHSKLHKLDAFLGLREKDDGDNCLHDSEGEDSHGHSHNHHRSNSFHTISLQESNTNHNNISHDYDSQHSHNHNHNHQDHSSNTQSKHNINVQAAFIHIIGDIIQSIGVIIAASLIYFFPSYQIIDPLTTILFSVIVITTTVPIIKQCIYAIMEGNTNAEDYTMIKNDLINTPGVISVKCFHLYYLSLDKAVLCAHVKVLQSTIECDLLKKIYEGLSKYKIYHCTIEISKDDNTSNTCNSDIG